ncbi:hypothetical protein ACGFKZ_29400 [Micromonospora tulbaghiae]|uniref:hypothetical protein n=1 Tax=Micromonospora tulbaghiae TaxID=479978 RepID=UPI0037142A01
MKRATYSGFVGMLDTVKEDGKTKKVPGEPVRIEAGKEYPDNAPVVQQRPDLFEDVK